MNAQRGPALPLWSVCVAVSITARVFAEPLPSFGQLVRAGVASELRWSEVSRASVTREAVWIAEADGVLRSAPLPLRSLRSYELRATMRAGPGTRAQLALGYSAATGEPRTWRPVWHTPLASRPDWVPVSPRLQTYTQSFVLPDGAREPRLELTVGPARTPQLRAYLLWELTKLELREGGVVPCCHALGPNRMIDGDMDSPGAAQLPQGWSDWMAQGASAAQLVSADDRQFVRVAAGKTATLGASHSVPVTRGAAYRISFWVRGQGHIDAMAHPQNGARPTPLRVGTPQPAAFEIDTPAWQERSMVWFAEARDVETARVLFGIAARGDLDVDDVEFRAYLR
jgi:hypothetical protein